VIIRQRVDECGGDTACVTRILRVEERLYVEVRHSADITERTLMRAVNRALGDFIIRCKYGRGYGTSHEEGDGVG